MKTFLVWRPCPPLGVVVVLAGLLYMLIRFPWGGQLDVIIITVAVLISLTIMMFISQGIEWPELTLINDEVGNNASAAAGS